MSETIHSAVEKYQNVRPTYEAFCTKLRSLFEDILKSNEVKFHIVEARAKEVSSFSEKISRPGKEYNNPLQEIKDLCGCRIIVFYQDDVKIVADVIKSEFTIAEENLSHQPNLLEADRFGYISAHYIVSLKDTRSKLLEWKLFDGLFAEVQVRTVIQHAWSAVAHTVLYKQEAKIPSMLQRRLHRIAGLFELADEEFVSVRIMREEASLQIKRQISEGAEGIPLSATSIIEFLATWAGAEKLKQQAKQVGFTVLKPEDIVSNFVSDIYDLSNLAGVNDVKGLQNALEAPAENFFSHLIGENRKSAVDWGVSLDFLVVLKLIHFAGRRVTKDYLTSRGFADSIADQVLRASQKIKPFKPPKSPRTQRK